MKARTLRKALGPLLLLGAVTVTLALAQLVSRQFFENPQAEPSMRPRHGATNRRPMAAAGDGAFQVMALQGEVHTQHDGRWYVVHAGDLLASTDVIRTRRGSRVLLKRGGSELDIHENVDLRLDDVAPESANFGVLRGGRLIAQVGNGREKLIITAQRVVIHQRRRRTLDHPGPSGRSRQRGHDEGAGALFGQGERGRDPRGHGEHRRVGRAAGPPWSHPRGTVALGGLA